MAMLADLDGVATAAPQLVSGVFTVVVVYLMYNAIVRLPGWIGKLRRWQEYCASHSKFSLEAGEGKYRWLEDPWSS